MTYHDIDYFSTQNKQEKDKREKDAKENPMAALEKRTEDSQREMLLLDNLAELTEQRKDHSKITDDIMLMAMQKSAAARYSEVTLRRCSCLIL